MTPPRETERVELQVLLANLLRTYHYLQICDQVLSTSGPRDESPRKPLDRVRAAAAMLETSCSDLLTSVTGVVATRPAP